MGQFQALFSGEVLEGANAAVVRQNLGRELSIDERKLDQLFSGRTVVLRSRLSQSEAESLQKKLSEIGAIVRIKDMMPEEKPAYVPQDKHSGPVEHTLHDLTAAHITCPRCGHMQLDAEFCARCGIDIAASLKKQRKDDLMIEKKIRELRTNNRDDSQSASKAGDHPWSDTERLTSEKREPQSTPKRKGWFRR